MAYSVVFTPKAKAQLLDLYDYIAVKSTPTVAERYVSAVVATCEDLQHYPHRGTKRDDIRPGLRLTNHKGRTTIAFTVDDQAKLVAILGIFHGGRNYSRILRQP